MPTLSGVTWVKNLQNNEWFDFLRLNLDSLYFSGKRGVFVLWYVTPQQAKVIRVGSGNLSEQLKNLRVNPVVISYANNGPLKISWIVSNGILQENQLNGVEAFLFRVYSPLIGERKVVEEIGVSPLIGKMQ